MVVFSGTVNSDFLKLGNIPENRKSALINTAGTDFQELKTNLTKYIQAVFPLDYSNFSNSDLGQYFVDLFAYMGAVISFKNDVLTGENFLQTATNRNNVRKLLANIGVNLRGPVAANGTATLTMDESVSAVEIPASDRVITINSPEDGATLNYTLYKTTNGLIDVTNTDASLSLTSTESNEASGLVWENLAFIEGALVVQTGQFSNTETIQTIELTESPVIERSIQVFVQGPADVSGAYTEVENLFSASGASDKVFQRVYDDNFAAVVVFGDNNLGISPTPGSTYTITYRIGGGSRGNLRESEINVPKNLAVTGGAGSTANGTLENNSLITGGVNAETVSHAKRYAPLTFRRQDRLVTGDDYTAFANSYIGPIGTTGKAKAVVRDAFSSANIIDIYVLERASDLQLQRASIAYKAGLLEAIEPKKMFTDEIVIVDGVVRTLDLIVTIRINKELEAFENDIKLKVARVVTDFFDADNFEFGSPFIRSNLTRRIFDLDDIVFATVDNLDEDVQVDFNELIQLNNVTINVTLV